MQFFRIVLLILLLYCASPAKAQEIQWQKDRPLTWKDFQGAVPDDNSSSASTSSYIKYEWQHRMRDTTHVLSFKIHCMFNPQASWKRKGQTNKDLLSHEQLHFDITELYARKLAQALNSATYTANYREEIQAIYKKVFDEWRDMETKYDTQSTHSREYGYQFIWEQHIHDELTKLPRNY
ncbi:MAG: DUF922 domain-containing protein [Bacteroidota bacterium]